MAKAAASRSVVGNRQAWPLRHPALFLGVLLLLAAAVYAVGYTIVQKHEVAAERTQFMQAKTDLDTLYAQIVKQVGEPAQHKALQYCSYTSVEFGQGARTCNVEYTIVLPSEVANQEKTVAMINDVIHKNPRYGRTHVGNLNTFQPQDTHEIGLLNFDYNAAISCSIDYWSFTGSSLPNNYFESRSAIPEGMYIDLGCGGSAKAEYFPVVQG